MANLKHNKEAYYQLRSAPGVRADVERRLAAIAKKANDDSGLADGYRTSSVQGRKKPQGRWRGTVITATAKAIKDNAKTQRLLRSLDAGRS